MIIVGLSVGGSCLINREILPVLQENHVCKEKGGDGVSRFYIRDNEIVFTAVTNKSQWVSKKGRGCVALKDIIDTCCSSRCNVMCENLPPTSYFAGQITTSNVYL